MVLNHRTRLGRHTGESLYRLAVPTTPVVAIDERAIPIYLSDDVFERLRAVFAGRTVRVLDTDVLRSADVKLTQWNTSARFESKDWLPHSSAFDLEQFRTQTDRWIEGPWISPGDGQPAAVVFRHVTRVGLPGLPHGVMWATRYQDETSGLVMRAMAYYDIVKDQFICRWDVFCD